MWRASTIRAANRNRRPAAARMRNKQNKRTRPRRRLPKRACRTSDEQLFCVEVYHAILTILPLRFAFLEERSYALLYILGIHQLIKIDFFSASEALVKVHGIPCVNRLLGDRKSSRAERG